MRMSIKRRVNLCRERSALDRVSRKKAFRIICGYALIDHGNRNG